MHQPRCTRRCLHEARGKEEKDAPCKPRQEESVSNMEQRRLVKLAAMKGAQVRLEEKEESATGMEQRSRVMMAALSTPRKEE